jgi:hypothetical protein
MKRATAWRCAAILLIAVGIAGARLLLWPDEVWNGRHELLAKMQASGTIEEIPASALPDRRRRGALVVDLRSGTDRPADTDSWRRREVVFLTVPDRRRSALIQIRKWRRSFDLKGVALAIEATK